MCLHLYFSFRLYSAGIYEFTMGTTGQVVRGRYSFVYVYENGEWLIAHHHSSVMPEGIVTAEPITEEEVRGLFEVWNAALQTLDPKEVAALYSKNGNLLPTLSDKQRLTFLEIEDYFINFLKYEPVGEILSGDVLVGTNWAQDAGIYEFTMGTTGEKVRGRYTFVYVYEDGKWRISQHHSSMMPEETTVEPITKIEVKNLFQLWNNALLTRNPDTVARRYAKEAVLLPTVSDVPRDTHELIEDYFVNFLAKGPEGQILESFVQIGQNWCSDVGIYEFYFRDTGDKVMGRYSFVYTFEDGMWMISHHHSSMMPEGGAGVADRLAPNVGDLVKKDEGSSTTLIVSLVVVAAVVVLGALTIYNKKKGNTETEPLNHKEGEVSAEERALP